MTDLLQPAYDSLDPDAQALVDRWAAELEGEPVETLTMFRFLVAMVAVRRGELREVRRGERDGVPIVVLVDEEREAFYGVEDPQLGDAEAVLVAEMERVLGGAQSRTCRVDRVVELGAGAGLGPPLSGLLPCLRLLARIGATPTQSPPRW